MSLPTFLLTARPARAADAAGDRTLYQALRARHLLELLGHCKAGTIDAELLRLRTAKVEQGAQRTADGSALELTFNVLFCQHAAKTGTYLVRLPLVPPTLPGPLSP